MRRSKNCFASDEIKKIGYDLKKEWNILEKNEIDLKGMDFDVQLAAYLLNSGSNLSWEDLVMQELGVMVQKEDKKRGQAALIFQEDEGDRRKIVPPSGSQFFPQRNLRKKTWQKSAPNKLTKARKKRLRNFLKNWKCHLLKYWRGWRRSG